MDPNIVKEIRRTYVLARALNIQYQFIRDYVKPDLKKAINDAKAKNSFFLKSIDDKFDNRYQQQQILNDEELAFQFLEYLDKTLSPNPLEDPNENNK